MAVTRPKKSVSIRRDQEEYLNTIAPAGSRLSSSCIQSALDLLMEASERYGRPFNANMLAGFTEDYQNDRSPSFRWGPF